MRKRCSGGSRLPADRKGVTVRKGRAATSHEGGRQSTFERPPIWAPGRIGRSRPCPPFAISWPRSRIRGVWQAWIPSASRWSREKERERELRACVRACWNDAERRFDIPTGWSLVQWTRDVAKDSDVSLEGGFPADQYFSSIRIDSSRYVYRQADKLICHVSWFYVCRFDDEFGEEISISKIHRDGSTLCQRIFWQPEHSRSLQIFIAIFPATNSSHWTNLFFKYCHWYLRILRFSSIFLSDICQK